jgi:hypothetical protein
MTAKNGPIRFPNNRFATSFPSAAPELVARTVFTSWQSGDFEAATFAAVCACGEVHTAASMILLRAHLGAHSCVDALGRPIELVPVDGDLTHDDAVVMLARLLDGLRGI